MLTLKFMQSEKILESEFYWSLSLFYVTYMSYVLQQTRSITIFNMSWEFPACLVVRTCAFIAVSQVQSLVGELRSRKPQGTVKRPQKTTKKKSLFSL